MASDVLLGTGFGLIDPILSIFVKDNIAGGTIFAAGFASTLFLFTKSIIQLPFSRYVDKHDDKVRWLIVGTFLVALVPFVYILASDISMVYIAQLLHGIGMGLAYPTWLGLWSTNLDKNHESFEWSLYSTILGFGTALTAAVGAALAQWVGFTMTFVFVGLSSLISCLILFALEKQAEKKRKLFGKFINILRKK
jgi:DHA1 family quinolone resistance protein-like MFS transporter